MKQSRIVNRHVAISKSDEEVLRRQECPQRHDNQLDPRGWQFSHVEVGADEDDESLERHDANGEKGEECEVDTHYLYDDTRALVHDELAHRETEHR